MTQAKSLQRDFCRQWDCPWHLSQLFDCLPNTCFYAKDLQGRFIMVNGAFAALFGAKGEDDMVGKTDHDFSPRDLADQYVAEDRRVIQTGQPLVHQAWLISDHRGAIQWYLSSKIPLFGHGGEVIGIAGVMHDIAEAGLSLKPYHEMEQVTSYVLAHYSEKIEIPMLARLAHLSVSQFDRRFKRLFQMSPQQFLLRVRVHAACRHLISTRESAAQIATKTGFYDQSYFTKQFQRRMGVTPTAYRRKYRSW